MSLGNRPTYAYPRPDATGLEKRFRSRSQNYPQIVNDFKTGNFTLPLEVYEMIKGLIKMFKNSGVPPAIWNRQYFIRALMKLRKVKEFDTYRFIENFERFPYEWKDAYQTMDNLRSILHVHNYRNRNKAKYFIE